MKLLVNEGLLTMNQQRHLKDYGNIWYHPKSISNILSMSNVKKNNRITYESNNRDIFILINKIPGGHEVIFTENKDALYCNYMSKTKGVSMLSIMEEN